MGHLALCNYGVAYWLKALELNFQQSFNYVVLLNWRNFNRDLHLSLFSFSYLEPHLLKILEPLIASHRKNILIQVIKLLIDALGDDSEHKGVVGAVVFENLIFQFDDNIDFLDGARKKGGFTEWYGISVDVDEVFGFGEFGGALGIFLRRFAHI